MRSALISTYRIGSDKCTLIGLGRSGFVCLSLISAATATAVETQRTKLTQVIKVKMDPVKSTPTAIAHCKSSDRSH